MSTREYAKNLFKMWADEDFCDQPTFDKLLFQVLNGQRAVNAVGIQPINFVRWRKPMRNGDTPATEQDIRDALARMEARRYVFLDEDTGELLIRTRIRNDELDKQPTMFLAALRDLAVLDSPKFAAVMITELALMETPEVNGDKDYSKRLRVSLRDTRHAAEQHLKTLAARYTPPTDGPTAGGSTGPTPRGTQGGSTRPAETQQAEGGSPGGSMGPPVSGSVSGSLTLVSTQVGESRAREIDKPTEPPRCRDCDTPLHTGADGRAHPSGKCPDCRRKPTEPNDDAEPPTRCKTHAALPADAEIPECPHCGNFAQAHARWQIRERRRRAQATSDTAKAEATLKADAIAACKLCDPDGYQPGHVVPCGHDATQAATNARGSAAVRAALAAKAAKPTEPEQAAADA